MRALVFEGPWKLTVTDRPEPEPAPDESLLRILSTGICGSDLHGFTGATGRRSPGQVMGHETVAEVLIDRSGKHAVGTIVTVNPLIGCGGCPDCNRGAKQRCPSRKVIGVDPAISSAFAERMTAPSDRLVTLPAGTPTRVGALIEPLAVGFHALRRAQATADDSILVVGAGPIGQAAALAARRIGATRIVVAEVNPHRRELVNSLGFEAVDPTTSGSGDIMRSLGGPATVAIDAVAATSTLEMSIGATATAGRIVLLGLAAPQIQLQAYDVTTAERSLLGSFGYDDQDFQQTSEWVAGRGDELLALIDYEVGLDDAPGAFEALAKGDLQASKILVRCT